MQCERGSVRTLPTPNPEEVAVSLSNDRVDVGIRTPTLDLVELRDSVSAAEQAVTYWSGELQRRVGELQALDGVFVSMLSALMGTQEARLDAGELAVRQAQARLARAQEGLQQAVAALAAGEEAHRRSADERVARIGRLELEADTIRGSSHPQAERLELLEAEAQHLRSELQGLTEAIEAGAGLRAFLGSQAVSRDPSRSGMLAQIGLIGGVGQGRLRQGLASDQEEAAVRARRFEEACAALGIDLRLETHTSGPSAASRLVDLATGLAADVPLGLSVADLHYASTIQDRLGAVREEVALTIEGLTGRLVQVRDRIEALDAERLELLEALGGR